MTNSISINKTKLSIKVQTFATVVAIVAAIVLPQCFHVMGQISGFGKNLGVFFCPMHFPIMIVGLLAGPFAGAIAGFVSPLISAGLTGMPAGVSLPLMMVELLGYGLAAGLLRNVNLNGVLKVLIIQIAGRLLRMLAVAVAIYAFGQKLPLLGIWLSVPKTILGIVLQLGFIPLIVFWVEHRKEN